MNDPSKRSSTVLVKNLPPGFKENQLVKLFSRFGDVSSAKIIPPNAQYPGGYGFVNYFDPNSCAEAIREMDHLMIDGFILLVNQAAPKFSDGTLDRSHVKPRSNGDLYVRSISGTYNSPSEGNDSSPLPSAFNRVNKFRPASEQQLSSFQPQQTVRNTSASNMGESDSSSPTRKPLWNDIPAQLPASTHGSPFHQGTTQIDPQRSIAAHAPLIVNQTYEVYLSNHAIPNVIFAATLEDYVSASLLLTEMNKNEKVAQIQANSYQSKLVVRQICSALYRKSWYRARVLEVGESMAHVEYIDWGIEDWCDPTLGIRPLAPEYCAEPALCIECILDGVPAKEKLSDAQNKALVDILVLDTKLSMTVLRIENGKPHVRLTLAERNLNEEVCAALLSSSIMKSNQPIHSQLNPPDLDLTEVHYVQLTHVDSQPECFHVILMRDGLVTIMNTLKDWDAKKQPLTAAPQPGTLACALYHGDDLWYRARIQSVTDRGYRVYFVDFGNEEIVPVEYLSECPAILRSIPWQSVQIKFAGIQLNDDERRALLKQFETERLEMKIVEKKQTTYHVDLMSNGKSLRDWIVELRKKSPAPIVQSTPTEAPKVPAPIKQTSPPPGFRSVAQSTQTVVNAPPTPSVESKSDAVKKLSRTVETMTTTESSTKEQSNNSSVNENLTTMIAEQRRQNRLLEKIAAAINTTNALLTQLVQRDDPS